MPLWGKTGNFRVPAGSSARIVQVPEAASQSFKRGDFVYLASNKATLLVAASSTYNSAKSDMGTNPCIGMALENASGTTDTLIDVVLCDNNVEFEVNAAHGTPASAVPAATHVGQIFELSNLTITDTAADLNGDTYTAATAWAYTVDDTTVTNSVGFVVTEVPASMIGVKYGKVWGKPTVGARAQLAR